MVLKLIHSQTWKEKAHTEAPEVAEAIEVITAIGAISVQGLIGAG